MATPKVYVICDNNCKYEGMTREQILAAITQAVTEGTIGDCDTGFITTIKTVNGTPLRFFVGTQAEYATLEDKSNLFAIITDDTTKEGILAAIEELQTNYTVLSEGLTNGTVVPKTAESATSATNARNDELGNRILETYHKRSNVMVNVTTPVNLPKPIYSKDATTQPTISLTDVMASSLQSSSIGISGTLAITNTSGWVYDDIDFSVLWASKDNQTGTIYALSTSTGITSSEQYNMVSLALKVGINSNNSLYSIGYPIMFSIADVSNTEGQERYFCSIETITIKTLNLFYR